MADTTQVQVTGKSQYEVAQSMAHQILISIEGRNWRDISRADYLNAVVDSMFALQCSRPE